MTCRGACWNPRIGWVHWKQRSKAILPPARLRGWVGAEPAARQVAGETGPGIRPARRSELFMSTAPAEQYYPGLEGVIAAETAICDLEGREGQGGLDYRGYAIEDLAGAVSYEE